MVVRFGLTTPFWHLSMSYGIFVCPSTRRMFHSVDQYLAYMMLNRSEDRARVMKAPNGYIAYTNLRDIIDKAESTSDSSVVVSDWSDAKHRKVIEDAVDLKFSQSAILADSLLRTGNRPIFDVSRLDDSFLCYADGRGNNVHGHALMRTRTRLDRGELLPYVVVPSK